MSSTDSTAATHASTRPAAPASSSRPAAVAGASRPAAPAVTVRYFAGARAAAGVDSEQREAGTLAALVEQLAGAHGDRLAKVLGACSFLVDGTSTRDRATALPPGATVDVLPPFAGG